LNKYLKTLDVYVCNVNYIKLYKIIGYDMWVHIW